jgi:hypothetical protein
MKQGALLVLLLAGLTACDPGGAPEAAQDGESARASVAAVGARPVPVRTAEAPIAPATLRAVEEFRRTVGGALPARLTGGASSMDALVARFVAALERADTVALIRMVMDRGEFIALHYPESIYIRPPYELLPDDVWFLARAQTEKGLTRLLRRYGGQPLGFIGYDCPEPPRREGPNRWWSGCTITRSIAGTHHAMRYFATIWERDGAYKFGGYSNDL